MKRPLLTLGVTLWLMAAATPAFAAVEDQAGVLTPAAKQQLEQALAGIANHRFDVVFVSQVNGRGIEAMAQALFDRRGLGGGDGVIALSVGDRKVGVKLGSGFSSRGVGSAAIQRHLKSDFYPAARSGRYGDGALALATGLVAESRSPSRRTSDGRVVSSGGRSSGGGGFPWGLLLFAGAVGGGLWFWSKHRGGGAGLGDRLDALKARHGRITAHALRLDEVSSLARFAEGVQKATFAELSRQATRLMGDARDQGERLTEAEQAVKGGKGGAEALVAKLELSLLEVEASAAAAVTTLDQLDNKLPGTADASLSASAGKAARRLGELAAVYKQLRDRATGANASAPAVEGRLAESERALTNPPVDLRGASRALDEAESAIADYRIAIEHEADREVERERARAQQSNYQGGGVSDGALLGAMMLNNQHHSHRDDGYSTGGFFDNDDDRRSDSGSSSEGSWDTGGSDSGGWDSGGSDSGSSGGDW